MARRRVGARRGRRPGARSPGSASPARCTASSRSTRRRASSVRRSSGTTSGRRTSAPRSRQRVGLERLIALTGNRALTGFTAPKLLWLRRHEPDAYARIARIMLPKDYVRLRLTGEWAIDAADASGTLLLDVERRDWSGGGARRARAAAPRGCRRVLESPERAGRRADEHALQGIAGRGRRRRPARGRARGRRRPARARSRSCSAPPASSSRRSRLRARRRGARARVLPRRARDVAGDGRDALRRRLARSGSTTRSPPTCRSTRWSPRRRRGSPAQRASLFLPYLAGERTPHADPDARGAFVGLQLRHDRGALVRAVLEGVAFGLRDSLDLLRGARAWTRRVARVSGGGARSRLVAPHRRVGARSPARARGVEEGSAFGAALLGGVAAGVFADVARSGRSVASASPTRSSPIRRGRRPTPSCTSATGPSIPPCTTARVRA